MAENLKYNNTFFLFIIIIIYYIFQILMLET